MDVYFRLAGCGADAGHRGGDGGGPGVREAAGEGEGKGEGEGEGEGEVPQPQRSEEECQHLPLQAGKESFQHVCYCNE